jgi:hypoxanthine-DNA glycosylase
MEEIKKALPPFFNSDSTVLILGSFPSVKSRQAEFFYGNKQNSFWGIIANYLSRPLPQTTEEKKELLSFGKIALWDVVQSCRITGSSDATICDYEVADIDWLLANTNIKTILINGGTAKRIYDKHFSHIKIKTVYLPSTSPANTRLNKEVWYEALRQACK